MKQMASHKTTGLKRNSLEKYYTKGDVCEACVRLVQPYINTTDVVIEPSAGNGSFIPYINRLGIDILCYDIQPEHSTIMKQDFLTLDLSKIKKKYSAVHIIGNPPFGRQSSMAIKFIKHASKHADTISFILPRSFKKESMRSKFPLCFHLVCETEIQANSFLIDKQEHNVPCVFQIWIKKDIDRIKPVILQPIGFKFVKKTDGPDVAFRRVGVYAGNVSTDLTTKNPQSHYFIRFQSRDIDECIKKISQSQFNTDNTVGPKSISKQELIHQYNRLLND